MIACYAIVFPLPERIVVALRSAYVKPNVMVLFFGAGDTLRNK